MQRFCRAGLRAFVAEDALRSVFPLAGFPVSLDIHGADAQAFAAMDAFALVAVDAQQRKITHELEKYRDGTQIFAERTIILKYKGKHNACDVIECVSGEEQPEHDLLQICNGTRCTVNELRKVFLCPAFGFSFALDLPA